MKSDDELKLDDPNEPNIEGNDDDFSDLSSVDSEEQMKAFQSCSSSIHPADLIAASSPEVFTPFPNLMKIITNESNRYAKQVMGDEKFAKRNGRGIEGFLKILHCYGCGPPASTDDYWRQDPLLHSGVVADTITHECYRDIFSLLTATHSQAN